MEITDNQERRRHIRVDFSTRIVLMAGDTEIEARGSSKDLSLKGVFVNTDKKVEAGSECNVKIFLSGGIGEIELAMKARVARVIDTGLGLSFESMDVDSYTHLKNIVLYNS